MYLFTGEQFIRSRLVDSEYIAHLEKSKSSKDFVVSDCVE